MNEKLKDYLKSSDLEANLDVGGDMRKIQYCYSYLKKLALAAGENVNVNQTLNNSVESAKPPETIDKTQDLTPLETKRLKEILQQRDNEISKFYF